MAFSFLECNKQFKLKFYATFKNDTKPFDFINHVKNPEHKITASKFRLGNHNLEIESVRLTIPKAAANLRICDQVLQS